MSMGQVIAEVINGGQVTGIPPHLIGTRESPDCQNLDPADPLGATTRPGSAIYGVTGPTTASGVVGTGLFPWTRNAATTYLFTQYATTVYSVDTGSWFSVKTGVTSGGMLQGAALNNIAILTGSGFASPQVSTAGSSLASLSATGTYSATLANYCTTWLSKMWLAGNGNKPNRVHFSKSGDPEDFNTASDAGYIDVDTDDGDIIYGVRGTKRAVYVFKRRSIYIITGTSASNFRPDLLCGNGVVGQYAHATDGQGIFWASDDGVWYAQGLSTSLLSGPVRDTYVNISDKSTIALEIKGEKLFVFYKSSGASNNDSALVLAYRRQKSSGKVDGVWVPYTSQPYSVAKTARGQNLYGLTNASSAQIYEIDTGTSATVSAYWNSPDFDFEEVESIKNLMRYFIHVKPPTTTTTLTVRFFANGASIGSDYTHEIGTVGSHIIDRRLQNLTDRISGRTIRMKLSWSGQMTIYGFRVIADVRSDGVAQR